MPSFAMKVYDRQWHAVYGMSPDRAAAELRADGIATVLCANRIDPLPTSGVDQEAYLHRATGQEATDRAWSAALREHGMFILQTSAMLFDPPALEVFPDAVPVNALGQPDPGIDWYRGVCPTHEGYLARKLERLATVLDELQPDGLFLQFIRYPGFWEQWTWNPDYVFTDADRTCFCDRCRVRFAADTDIDLPPGDAAAQARIILSEHAPRWDAWRSARIRDIVAGVRALVKERNRDGQLWLNTLPFPSSDFGGTDVRRTIAAQDLALLAPIVDRFELMTYLQILKRPSGWIAEAVADARERLNDSRPGLVCTLQVDALYTDGMHAERLRAPVVTAADLVEQARAALETGADGLVFYHWTDFLVDEAEGGAKRAALRLITGA